MPWSVSTRRRRCGRTPKIASGDSCSGSPRRLWSLPAARAHDIPNQRVDRSIQVTLGPGRLEIDYEVSLSELTLTQDLRALDGYVAGRRSLVLAGSLCRGDRAAEREGACWSPSMVSR